MAHALEEDPRYVTASHHEDGVAIGRVGLGWVGSESGVAWNRDRTRCLVMEGELYDTVRLRADLTQSDEVPGHTHADLVLRAYETSGACGLSHLNGAFVAALWDRPARALVLFNDRLGLAPLYYTTVNEDLLFASGVRALMADNGVSRQVDHVAINQFLVFDHMLDDRTLLDGVRLLPQGSVLTFQDGQLKLQQYWRPRYPEFYEPQSEEACLEQFAHLLRQAVGRQRQDTGPATVLLSGGLDSRLVAGPLVENGATIDTLTFGIPGCDDAIVAAEVAARLGTTHRFVELKPDWLLQLAGEGVRVADGLANVVNLHVLAIGGAHARDGQVVFKGFMGDALLGFALKPQMWADYQPATRYDVHLGVHASQGVVAYDRQEQQKLLTDDFRARAGDGWIEAYREGMDRSGVSQLANQRLYFDLTQRVPRMTLGGVVAARQTAAVRLPFCDNDLVDFVLGVPPGFLFERRLPKAALVKYFPHLARIPIASTGRPLVSCMRDVIAQTRGLAAWHLEKYGLGRLAARRRRPYKDYDRWLRTVLRPWVEQVLLDRRTLERGYFQPDYIRHLVADHMGGASHGVRLGGLITLELWHRQFLD